MVTSDRDEIGGKINIICQMNLIYFFYNILFIIL